MRSASGIKNDLRLPGTKGRAFRGATLIRRCRTLVTDGSSTFVVADRRCPVSLALCAGAYWRPRKPAWRSVRRLPGPFPVVVVPARTSRRISGSTCDEYSSRSQPKVFAMSAEYGSVGGDRQHPQWPTRTAGGHDAAEYRCGDGNPLRGVP